MSDAAADHLRSLGFTAYRLPSIYGVEMSVGSASKDTLAQVLYPNQTCDPALPKPWVDYAAGHDLDVRPGWIMLYDSLIKEAAFMGHPMPLYWEALTDILTCEDRFLRDVGKRSYEILEDLLDRQSPPEENPGESF